MKYEFNLENLRRIIQSPVVPKAPEPLSFEIAQATVSIKQKYVDRDGDEMGNSILIDTNDGLMIFVSIENDQFLSTLYRLNAHDKFIPLEAGSPRAIINFSGKIWMKIIDKIEELENETRNLVSWEDFSAQFKNHDIPSDLRKLYDFEGIYGYGNFAESFFLNTFHQTGLKSWSDNPVFLNAFIEFASANGSGSSYAYWLSDPDMEQCPIVVFGDEGGIYIVAENTKQFLRLLTYDTEISVYQRAYFYRDEDDDYEPSEFKEEFVQWVQESFGLQSLNTSEQADEIINKAGEKYQQQLDDFLKQYNIEN